MKFLFQLTLLIMLSACSKRTDVQDLSAYFFENQLAFNQIRDIGCSLNETLNTQFHYYKADTALQYPEHLATQFMKIDKMLKKMKATGITIRPHLKSGAECSLYIRSWAFGFAGDGGEMGYNYQPAKLFEYDPAIHLEENRNFKEKIHFTKALSDGWFIEYVNEP